MIDAAGDPPTSPPPAPARRRGLYGLAFAWGLAEATFFFFVPDILITRIALRDLRTSLIAAFWALTGALLGGLSLWIAAQRGASLPLLALFDLLPGISRELLAETARAVESQGAMALFGGAWRGQPYKLFAVHAGEQNVPLLAFLVASLFARLIRFSATAIVAWAIGRRLHFLPERTRLVLHTTVWGGFYTFYFTAMR